MDFKECFVVLVICISCTSAIIWYEGLEEQLQCPVNDEGIDVVWIKQSGEQRNISSDDGFSFRNGGRILVINEVGQADSGLYSCFNVSNGKPEFLLASFNVTISSEKDKTPPYLEKGVMQNQTKYVGEDVSIFCYDLISKIPRFHWFKSKDVVRLDVNELKNWTNKANVDKIPSNHYKQISKKEDRIHNVRTIRGVKLILTNLTLNDMGWYACYVSNDVGTDYLNMFLNVKEKESYPPLIFKSRMRKNNTLKVGSDINLVCHASGPGILKYTWYKNGRLLPTPRGYTEHQPVLPLRDVTPGRSGRYTCVVKNAFEEIQFTYSVKVEVDKEKKKESKSNNGKVIAGSVFGGLMFLLLIFIIFLFCRYWGVDVGKTFRSSNRGGGNTYYYSGGDCNCDDD